MVTNESVFPYRSKYSAHAPPEPEPGSADGDMPAKDELMEWGEVSDTPGGDITSQPSVAETDTDQPTTGPHDQENSELILMQGGVFSPNHDDGNSDNATTSSEPSSAYQPGAFPKRIDRRLSFNINSDKVDDEDVIDYPSRATRRGLPTISENQSSLKPHAKEEELSPKIIRRSARLQCIPGRTYDTEWGAPCIPVKPNPAKDDE